MPLRDPQILKYFSMGMMTNLSWDCPKTEPLVLATPTISKGIPSTTMFRPTALELGKSCSLTSLPMNAEARPRSFSVSDRNRPSTAWTLLISAMLGEARGHFESLIAGVDGGQHFL